MSTYNAENYIEEQIESILNQTASNWILTILDDCSTDSTPEILKTYRKKYPERIWVYSNKKNIGSAKENFFRLLKFSKYNYVMFCDHDDVWKKNKIERTYRRMLELEQYVQGRQIPLLVHTDLTTVDKDLNVLEESFVNSQGLDPRHIRISRLLSQGVVTGCTTMINRTLINMMGNSSENIIMHDWWACLIAACFGKISFLNESTILYRQHKGNQVGSKKINNLFYNLKRLFEVRKSKKAVNDTYLQASEFYNRFSEDLSKKQAKIIKIYADMQKYNKYQRICTLKKYKMFKKGIFRQLGQILYC